MPIFVNSFNRITRVFALFVKIGRVIGKKSKFCKSINRKNRVLTSPARFDDAGEESRVLKEGKA